MTMQGSDSGVVKILVLFRCDFRNQIGVMDIWVAAREVLPPHSAWLVMLLTNCFLPFFCRFYSRDSGLLKFKIHAGFLGRPIPPTGKRLVAFTFHPLYPFAISVQKTNAEYVVNFHIRHLTSGVEHT